MIFLFVTTAPHKRPQTLEEAQRKAEAMQRVLRSAMHDDDLEVSPAFVDDGEGVHTNGSTMGS